MRPSVIIGGSNDFTNPQDQFGFGANLKYQLTHYLAFQGDFMKGKLKGNQDKLLGSGRPPDSRPITSFETDLKWGLSFSGVITYGNINWLRMKNFLIPYVSVGGGLVSYEPKIVKRGTTELVPFFTEFELPIREFFVPVTVGVKVKITKALNVDIGYRMNFVDADNFDGYAYYTVPPEQSSTVKKDKFQYVFAGIEYSIGKKSKSQLMFDNPASRANSIIQSQINTLTTKVDSLISKQKSLDDTDGDSVADLYDKEPNTPAGCPVDASGVMRDTDGDGIVDCKDKQLITPTECQPVDADGVGKCPDPECCKTRMGTGDGDNSNANCPSDYPSLTFRGNGIRLTRDVQAVIATIASKIKSRPDCKIMIKGYPETSKSSQAACQKRVDAIKLQLIEREGVSADRITTNCEVGGGDKNTVDISTN
ncbi:MAG: DUF6089 family protein [Ferruginibacter sp.]